MNKKMIGVISLVAVASIAGGVLYSGNQASRPSDKNDHLIPVVAAPAAQSSGRAPTISRSIPGRVMERGPLEGVERFGQLLERLKSSTVSPAQKAQYLLTAAQVCEGAKDGRQVIRSEEANKTYIQYTDRFCSDFSGSSNDFALELLKYPESDVVMAREFASGAPLERGVAIAAQDIVLTSENPDAIYNAAAALASGTWAFGLEVAQTPQERSMLHEAQWIASQRLACDLSGGCAAGGLTTMVECASYGICEPGITVSDVFARTQSEAKLDLADRLYARLVEARSEAAEKPAS